MSETCFETTDSELAKEIVKSLSNLINDEKLADFTVVVEDSVFKCHRSILGACSSFFYWMFTTDMMEKKNNTARLHDIESLVFEIILKVCYTGKDVVNKENVLSIWQCAHRLQISFLVEHCENFAVCNLSLENFAKFSRVATILDSRSVLGVMHDFSLRNFMKLKDDEIFLELSVSKVIEIIQSDELEVTSEDDVLFFIYKWVQRTSNYDSGFKSQNETNNEKSALRDMLVDPHAETEDVTNSNGNVSETPKLSNEIGPTHQLAQDRSSHLKCLLQASRLCLASPLVLKNYTITILLKKIKV